jgi:hypothetical protein
LTTVKALALKTVGSSVARNEHVPLYRLETELDQKFGTKGTLFKQMGYGTPNDFINDIAEFELYHSKSGDTCVRFNRQTALAVPATTVPAKNELVAHAKRFVIEVTREAEVSGRPLKVVLLASRVIERFQLKGTVGKALGAKSFLAFLASVKEVEVFLSNSEHYVRLKK